MEGPAYPRDPHLRHIEHQLGGAVRQHQQHRCARPREFADPAQHIADTPGRGRDELALRQPPARLRQGGLGLLDRILARLDLVRPRRQTRDIEIGGILAHACGRDIARRLRLVEIGLGRDAAPQQVLPAFKRPLGFALLRLGRGEIGLDHRDLFRPPADAQIVELRLRLH